MAQHFKTAFNFRKNFTICDKELLHWFPGHMGKGLRQMQQKLKMVDCVVEVHDSRIPFTGRNPNFEMSLYSGRPHILVLNKKDLTDSSLNPRVTQLLKAQNVQNVVYTNCKDDRCPGVRSIFPLMEDLIKKSERYNRTDIPDHTVMIIGVPNVGKSSLINRLRNRYLKKSSASPVGGVAGITRSVLNRIRISEDPSVFMLDTPGILQPSVTDVTAGLKLALCASIPDHLVGDDIIADYLLFWLNKHERFEYVKLMGLNEPSDDISKVLIQGALHHNKFRNYSKYDGTRNKMPDFMSAAKIMTRAFRGGQLGKLFLDRDVIDTLQPRMELS